MVNRSQISLPTSVPKRSVRDLRRWILRLSITRWMVPASGYWRTNCAATCANSKAERSGVVWLPEMLPQREVIQLLTHATDADRAAAWAEIEGALRQFKSADEIVTPQTFLIGVGTK